jgi:hypothetical protein
MIRWAVGTTAGKNYRVYAENRLLAVSRVVRETGEKWSGVVLEAGYVDDGRVTRPEWDYVAMQGWPGGPSGRPRSKKDQKQVPQEASVAKPLPALAPTPTPTCVAVQPPAVDPCGQPATHLVTWKGEGDPPSTRCHPCALKTQQLAQSHNGGGLSITKLEAT